MTDYFEKAKQILPQGFAMKKDIEWLASRLEKADKYEALAIPIHSGNVSANNMVKDVKGNEKG